MRVSFTIPGEPKSKERHRDFTLPDGRRIHYTPAQTRYYENFVKTNYMVQCRNRKLSGALEARIKGVFPVPKSESKRRRVLMLLNQIHFTKKIDCDNLAKIILDSLNKIAYEDDKQVCRLLVEKVYGEEPRVDVTITEIGE